MKKLICLMLCLLLPVSALAAPMRDLRESVLEKEELSALRPWLDAAVRDALPLEYDENTYVGARVYSCVEEGGCYVLECDVYLEEGGDTLPEYAPDDALTWLCDATAYVRRAADGYELISCDVGDYYRSQRAVTVEGEGYSVSLPDLYAVHPEDAYDYSCYDENGAFVSGIRYRVEDVGDMSLQAYAQALLGESEGGMLVNMLEDIRLFTAQDAGMYVIVYAAEDQFHSLTVTYPEEREAEFTLYAEFMRNSFVVEGEANG